MRNETFIFILCSWFLAVVVSASAQLPAINNQDVESRALAARHTIQNGFLELESTSTSDDRINNNPDGHLRKFQSKYQFWFAKDRTRLDFFQKRIDVVIPDNIFIECMNFDGSGKNFKHSNDINTLAYQGKAMKLDYAFDPRTIGYHCSSLNTLRQSKKMERFGHPDTTRQNITTENVLLDRKEMILISWVDPPTAKEKLGGFRSIYCKMWISPSEGYNVKKDISWGNDKSGKEEWRYEIENTLQNYDGTWFINGFQYKSRNVDGYTKTETVKVTNAWFNREDPLEVSDIKRFGMKPGQNIYDKDTKKTFIFDGDNARVDVAEELAKVASNATPLAPIPGTINYWLVAVCVGAAGVGAFLIFRLLQKGRANADS